MGRLVCPDGELKCKKGRSPKLLLKGRLTVNGKNERSVREGDECSLAVPGRLSESCTNGIAYGIAQSKHGRYGSILRAVLVFLTASSQDDDWELPWSRLTHPEFFAMTAVAWLYTELVVMGKPLLTWAHNLVL